MNQTSCFHQRRQQQKAAKRARKQRHAWNPPPLDSGASSGEGRATFVSFNAKTMRFETTRFREDEQEALSQVLADAQAKGEDLSQAEILARLRGGAQG